MKKIIKFVSIVALGLGLAACSKMASSKSEVEATFDAFTGTLPQLTLATNPTVDAMAGTAVVKLTVAGLDTNLDSLSVGILSSTDPTFATANFVKIDNPTDGTSEVTLKVIPNSTCYIKAAAACIQESAYSETLEVKIPDIPFWAKIGGKSYAADIVSIAYGDEYTHKISIILDETDPENKCIIADIEPYYAGKRVVYSPEQPLNYVNATIDNQNNAIIVDLGADMHLTDSETSRVFYGVNDEGSDFISQYAFTLSPDGSSLISVGGYYTVTVANNSVEDAYSGGVYKQL